MATHRLPSHSSPALPSPVDAQHSPAWRVPRWKISCGRHVKAVVSGSHLAVVSASTLTLSGGTVGAGATVSATSGSTLIVSGRLADSGTSRNLARIDIAAACVQAI